MAFIIKIVRLNNLCTKIWSTFTFIYKVKFDVSSSHIRLGGKLNLSDQEQTFKGCAFYVKKL